MRPRSEKNPHKNNARTQDGRGEKKRKIFLTRHLFPHSESIVQTFNMCGFHILAMIVTFANHVKAAYDQERFLNLNLTLPGSGFDATYLVVGGALILGLAALSFGLYYADLFLTARLDQFLLDYYGPEIYDRLTQEFHPDGGVYDSPVGLKATTAAQYYGYGRKIKELDLATRVLGLIGVARELYDRKKS